VTRRKGIVMGLAVGILVAVLAGWTAVVTPLHALLTENFGSELYLLMGAVGLVLFVACGNVANLMIVRGTARTTEIAVRTAVGSPRHRVIRLLMTEAMVLSLLGGTAGLLLTVWGTDLLISLVPADIPRASESEIDGRVLGFALGKDGTPDALRVSHRFDVGIQNV